jgi:hypothetical protein
MLCLTSKKYEYVGTKDNCLWFKAKFSKDEEYLLCKRASFYLDGFRRLMTHTQRFDDFTVSRI